MLRRITCVFVVGLIACRGSSRSAAPAPPKLAPTAAALAELMTRYDRLGQLSGAVLVAKDGNELYRGAFGLANRDLGVPNTTDTRFAIGSITKTFTAFIVLRLIERGTLRFDAHVRDYLPEYPSPRGDQITIEQLLTHTSGMAGDIGDFPPNGNNFDADVAKINEEFYSLDELVAKIALRPPVGEAGTFSYSSDGYAVLGAIIQRVAGKPYAEVLKDEIVVPLGLTATDYGARRRIIPHRATGYRETWGGYEVGRPYGTTPAGGDGGIVSTVGDLLIVDQALRGDALLSTATRERIWKPTTYITAYGWKVRSDAGTVVTVQASGALTGFNALFTRTIADGVTVIILVNTRDMVFRLDAITANAIAIVRGQAAPEPIRASAARVLADALASGPADAALAQFAARDPATTYVDESELNSLGYFYMQRDPPTSVAVLRINTELFPKSGNAFDSLGEAYLTAGDREQAIASYRRSLELDPSNTNASAMLKRLRDAKP